VSSLALQLFRSFPSLKVPLREFLHLLPRLQPRPYTIASSSLVLPTTIHVAVSMQDTAKPGGDASRRLRGVCSSYMARLQPGASARVFLRGSTFHLPGDASLPVLLIGPGTGIAPMRAFLQVCLVTV
jgi:NADPH-ferrihemoprotein reductase